MVFLVFPGHRHQVSAVRGIPQGSQGAAICGTILRQGHRVVPQEQGTTDGN